MFAHLAEGAWRQTTVFEGKPVEVFAQDPETFAYFCREIDAPSGRPILPAMVLEGTVVLCRSQHILDTARSIAAETIEQGPPMLDPTAVELRRYAITDLATAIGHDRSSHVQLAAASALYGQLADFALRAAGRWSASAKAMPCRLARLDLQLPPRFEAAFAALFRTGNPDRVQSLVDDVLSPYGGRLRDGFARHAPKEWRDSSPPGSSHPVIADDADQVVQLELRLLDPAVRRTPGEVDRLLAAEFVEIGSSGSTDDKAATLAGLVAESDRNTAPERTITGMQARLLAADVALVTYRAQRAYTDGTRSASLRSSIWQRQGGAWRMIFHQGTPAVALEIDERTHIPQ